MKIKKLLVALAGSATLFACSSAPAAYTVTGTVKDSSLNGKTIYINCYDTRQNVDSTIVQGNNFTFTGKADSSLFCRIDAGREFANFMLENGNITVDLENHYFPSGTPLNETFSGVFRLRDSMRKAIWNKNKELETGYPDLTERRKKQKEYFQQEWKPAFIAGNMAILEQNPGTDIASVVLQQIDYLLTPDEMEAAIAKADSTIRQRKTLRSMAKQAALQKKTAVGQPFADFTAETVDGKPIALSDYAGKGKYTLVDFWASWCGPCRAEMPNIAETYRQYKDKGLEVVSVAMWDKPENSRKAITELGSTWPQIINAEMKPMDLYGFNGIPFIILIAPDGTIAARDLRGIDIRLKVQEVLDQQQ